MAELRFRGTLFERLGAHGSRVEASFDVPWTTDEVVAAFGEQPALAKDDQQLWSAAAYAEGANRGNAGLEHNWAAVLDGDCKDLGEMDAVCDHLLKQGLAFIVYTSWSHGRRDKLHADTNKCGPFDCFRIVLPYSRHVSPGEHAAIVQGLYGHEIPNDPPHYHAEVLGKLVTLPSGRERAARPRGWDAVCVRPAQGYYAPAEHAALEVHPGSALDVEKVLCRPTTARPSYRTARPYHRPTQLAVGAVGALQRALTKANFWLSEPNVGGWHRAQCPSCQDPSPSLTLRANGDGVDIHCHAGCKRKEVLDALGLEGDIWRAPSTLRISLDEQLVYQTPDEPAEPVNEASAWLVRTLREAVASREPTVIQTDCGVGKATPQL